MITAMTVWENRISPVFDSSHMLLIAEIKENEISNRHYESFNPSLPSHLTDWLSSMGVEVLICGAISQVPADIIETRGIQLIPFIAGKADEILEHWAKGTSLVPAFLMPGCERQHGNQACRKRKCISANSFEKEVINMPRGDGTGPKGQGAGKGRGQGACKSGQGRKGSGRKSGQGNRSGQGSGQGRNKGSQRRTKS